MRKLVCALLSILLFCGLFVSTSFAQETEKCNWIKLNTTVPFIGNCIEVNSSTDNDTTTSVTQLTAFPRLMSWLSKIVMTAIFVFSFLMVIASGVMMVVWSMKWATANYDKWVSLLTKVITSLIMLGCVWLILKVLNPSFFW